MKDKSHGLGKLETSRHKLGRLLGPIVGMLLVLTCQTARSEEQDPLGKLALLEKVAYSLTGLPPTDAQKKAFLDGSKSIVAIADEMRLSPAFETHLTEYWLQVLKIFAPINIFDHIDQARSNATEKIVFSDYLMNEDYANGGLNANEGRTTRALRWQPFQQYYHLVYYPEWANSEEFAEHICYANNNLVDVVPFWDKTQTVKACRGLIRDEYCGPDLSKCFPDAGLTQNADGNNNYTRDVRAAFTYEPGRFIAKTVVDDRPWDSVLTSKQTVANGPMLHFLHHFGKPLIERFAPPGSYPGYDKLDLYRTAEIGDTKYRWIDRGENHSGVTTMMAFHKTTNGWRAKFNRVFTSFLCREFKVPDGVKEVPSDETELIRKPVCQSCHVPLEPASQFFGKWPTLGDTSYYYSRDASRSAIGQFNGVEDSDTDGLGRIIVNTKEFYQCGVQRAFEFLVGRPMSGAEEKRMLEPLTKLFLEQDKHLWPVMRQILMSPAFQGAARE